MRGTLRQQRQFIFVGRPVAAVVALGSFAVLELVRPSDEVERFLALCAGFAVVTVPLSWLATRRWPVNLVARGVLLVDVVMIATFVWALDRESLLIAVYFAPIAFGALMFGPRATLELGALALAATFVIVAVRDYDTVTVVPDIVLLAVLTAIVASLSRETREAQRQLQVDAAALRIAERFRESLEHERVLNQAVEDLGTATAATHVRLRLAPQSDGSARAYTWERRGVEPLDPVEAPPAIRTAETQQPLVFDAATTDDPEVREYLRRFGARTFLGYPIVWQNTTIATLGFLDRRQRTWRRSLALLDRVAPQLAAALVQADLYRQQQATAHLREELIANVSHELRTPLTATIGFLKTLEREDVHLDAQQRREFLAVSRREAERLARLVADLLHLTRLERGTISLVREPASISALAQRAARDVEVPQGRAVHVDCPDDLVALVDGDRILQVLTNLLTNGVRHGSGDVTLTARGNGVVRITVSDEGSGVAPEHVELMFEPFARWSRHSDSSGLGLAIARRLVEAHGGTLEYHPRVDGRPHAFVVELPA